MTSLPSPNSNEYFANKNGHIEALGRETLTYHLEACARHVEHAIIRTATLNNSGLMDHLFTGSSAFTTDIPPVVQILLMGGSQKKVRKRTINCKMMILNCLKRKESVQPKIEVRTYKKLRVGTTSKRVVSVKLIYKFNGSFLIITSLYLVATLPFTVYGEFSSHEDRKVNEQYYGELIYDSHRRVNNPETFEDHTRTDIEHSSSIAHVKDGENDVKLRILVPTKNTFPEFIKVDHELLIFIVFNKSKCWKTGRSLPCNSVIEASNTEEIFNSSDIGMNGSRVNESSHIVEIGSDQTTPTDNPLEVEVIQTSLSHTKMAFQDNAVPSDETENMVDYLARSSTEDLDTTVVRYLNSDR
ncbi:hypothetical protein MRB53_013358 [Persea americana]|uniref:Uncharacterized protein n=1 Tax=Persea americana TaxID=3435 RepID=A0ACC2K7T9_PERAE|nr:hypothetical protein MRB53_013358 [Persea americana]